MIEVDDRGGGEEGVEIQVQPEGSLRIGRNARGRKKEREGER